MRRFLVPLIVLFIFTSVWAGQVMTKGREPQNIDEIVADLGEKVRRLETLLGGGNQTTTEWDSVVASDAVTSSTYAVPPTNAGPDVSVVVGRTGVLRVDWAATISADPTAGGSGGFASFRVIDADGVELVAAADAQAIVNEPGIGMSDGIIISGTRIVVLEGLTPGPVTVQTMLKRTGAGANPVISNRFLIATPQ